MSSCLASGTVLSAALLCGCVDAFFFPLRHCREVEMKTLNGTKNDLFHCFVVL